MRGILVISILLLSVGCGTTNYEPIVSNSQSACVANQAQIAISDGYVQDLCGCAEGSGQPVPGNLTCTVNAGMQVFFQYIATQQKHEVVSTTNGFAPSPLSDPTGPAALITSYPVVFSTPGVFPFEDDFDNALNGTIVVQ